MSRWITRMSLLAVAALTLAVPSSQAREVRSTLGFSAEVPDDWIWLSREEAKQNPDFFQDFETKLKGFSPEIVKKIRQELEAGRVEFCFLPSGTPVFRNNINIRKQVGRHPATEQEIQKMCRELEPALVKGLGRPTTINTCESVQLPGARGVFVDWTTDGAPARTVQYQIVRSDVALVVVTGSFTPDTLAASRKAFDAFVRSIQFK